MDAAVANLGKLGQIEQSVGACVAPRTVRASNSQRIGDVLRHREVRNV